MQDYCNRAELTERCSADYRNDMFPVRKDEVDGKDFPPKALLNRTVKPIATG